MHERSEMFNAVEYWGPFDILEWDEGVTIGDVQRELAFIANGMEPRPPMNKARDDAPYVWQWVQYAAKFRPDHTITHIIGY